MLRVLEGKSVVLGNKYKDTVLGIVGIATSYCEYLTGCDQVGLTRVIAGESKTYWTDITRIEGVEVKEEDEKPGGPADTPPTRQPM